MAMRLENHKEEVPFAHYAQRFRALAPEDALSRLGALRYDGREFFLRLLGREYAVSHAECAFRALDGGSVPGLPTQTFLLRYLLEGRDVPWGGSWTTFREMPWGEMYSQPYTGRVLQRAAFGFGTNVARFSAACRQLGARELKHGDAGFEFDFLDGYRLQLLVWAGDEEFPPNAQLIYSDNFAEGFAAEDRVVTGDILTSTIKAQL